MALAALGAATVLDVGPRAAEAAPSVSPFVGKYGPGHLPGAVLLYTVSVSKSGSVSGRGVGYVFWGEGYEGSGKLRGRVSDAGLLSLHVDETYQRVSSSGGHITPGPVHNERDIEATVTLDQSGNLVGTTTDGRGLMLIRQ